MKCCEIIERLKVLAPSELAESWDNSGFLTGSLEKDVENVMIVLDVTEEVIKKAVEQKTDLIISHHPVIFKALSSITDEDFKGSQIYQLLKHDIACYGMHTNFDAASGCMADLAAGKLGLKDGAPLLPLKEPYSHLGIGKHGRMDESWTLHAMSERVKEVFDLPHVIVYGDLKSSRNIARVGICPGSGRSMISHAAHKKLDVLITGDIGHHEGLDALSQGVSVIDAGHYGLEYMFLPFVAGYLMSEFGDQIHILYEPKKIPFQIL